MRMISWIVLSIGINSSVQADGPPVGSVFNYAGNTVPKNYLPCDGRSLSKTEYDALHQVIGTQYGGDETTFKLPNASDRFILIGGPKGEIGGRQELRIRDENLPPHRHPYFDVLFSEYEDRWKRDNYTAQKGQNPDSIQKAYESGQLFIHKNPGGIGLKGYTDNDNSGFAERRPGDLNRTPNKPINTIPPYLKLGCVIRARNPQPKPILPTGTILTFDLSTCPEGWSKFQAGSGRVIIGSGKGRELRDMGGSETQTLAVGQMPQHSHKYKTTVACGVPDHKKCVKTNAGKIDGHTSTLTAGEGKPYSIMQPYIALTMCRKD